MTLSKTVTNALNKHWGLCSVKLTNIKLSYINKIRQKQRRRPDFRVLMTSRDDVVKLTCTLSHRRHASIPVVLRENNKSSGTDEACRPYRERVVWILKSTDRQTVQPTEREFTGRLPSRLLPGSPLGSTHVRHVTLPDWLGEGDVAKRICNNSRILLRKLGRNWILF